MVVEARERKRLGFLREIRNQNIHKKISGDCKESISKESSMGIQKGMGSI